ncbi:hypothetical protein CEXT_65721 [Caerostris extrusa]|uniref:Uncharacterized protein n=1 Tax=Caerostris extrusa TaxID=172846 RepID=A0AAV4R1B9_CAEEX|nr:hypothetical protein CEXT_65721 [Caerostris extrusa]
MLCMAVDRNRFVHRNRIRELVSSIPKALSLPFVLQSWILSPFLGHLFLEEIPSLQFAKVLMSLFGGWRSFFFPSLDFFPVTTRGKYWLLLQVSVACSEKNF